MIKVTKIGGELIYVNADLIEFIENVPDTMITLTTGKKIIIKEETEDVVNKVVQYRRSILG